YGDCIHVEYGNPFDNMGGTVISLHFQGLYKEILSWIETDKSLTITKSGNYTLSSLESDNGYKFAKIKTQESGDTIFTLEHRNGTGFNSTLNRADIASNKNGLLIAKVVPGYVTTTQLLNPHPNPDNSLYPDWSEMIRSLSLNPKDQPFRDPGHGITVGPVTAVSGDSISFDVSIDPPSCQRNIPQVVAQSSSKDLIVGGGGFANITITNRDYFGCGPSDFEVVWSLPHSWKISDYYPDSSQTEQNKFTIQPGEEIHKSVVFSVPEAAEPGGYKIKAVVINNDGNVNKSVEIGINIVGRITISKLVPDSGLIGDNVTIHGSGFPHKANCPIGYDCGSFDPNFQIYFRNYPVETAIITGSSTATFNIPSTISINTGKGFMEKVPTPRGTYDVNICYANFCTYPLPFSVTTANYTAPAASVIGSSTLTMKYDNRKEEESLMGLFDININAGSEDKKITRSDAFYSYLMSADGNRTPSNQVRYEKQPTSPLDTDEYYLIPAGTNAKFTIQARFDPRILFAGKYTAMIDNILLGEGANYNWLKIPEPNKTNTLVVIGEKSPYIYSVSPNTISPDEFITIKGIRFASSIQPSPAALIETKQTPSQINIVTFTPLRRTPCPADDDCPKPKQYNISSPDGTTLHFAPKLPVGTYTLQVTHPQTGKSNFSWFAVSDSPKGITREDSASLLGKLVSGAQKTYRSIVSTVSNLVGIPIQTPSTTPSPSPSPSNTTRNTSSNQIPTPTVTSSPKTTPTPSPSNSNTPTPTQTTTPTPTPFTTNTPTPSSTYSSLPTATITPSPSTTVSPHTSPSQTSSPSPTSVITPTSIPTNSPTPSYSPTPTVTPTVTHSPSPTYSETPTSSPTPSVTYTPTSTPSTSSGQAGATPTSSPSPSGSPSAYYDGLNLTASILRAISLLMLDF
ncbi:MAG: hypothetical protein WCT02_03065, partial [Candidatus Paceibacterota bacterium]